MPGIIERLSDQKFSAITTAITAVVTALITVGTTIAVRPSATSANKCPVDRSFVSQVSSYANNVDGWLEKGVASLDNLLQARSNVDTGELQILKNNVFGQLKSQTKDLGAAAAVARESCQQ
jgi:hypothetical protein